VLIVDEDDFGRETLGQILQEDCYRVLRAATGAEAIGLLQEQPRPGLIVLDLFLPRLDAWQLARELQRDPGLAELPVIVVSAVDRPLLRRHIQGVVAHFEKPVTVPELLAAIHRHLPPG
jgi:CheY-like chemotaxis protein